MSTSTHQQPSPTSAPVDSLPNELICQIFLELCTSEKLAIPLSRGKGKPSAPWNLSHVCSRWRKNALSWPRLWSNIEISYQREHDEHDDTVRDILARSETHPLSLTLSDTSGRNWDAEQRRFTAIEPHLHRLRSLTISSLPMSFFSLLSDVTPSLEEIELHCMGLPNFAYLGDLPNLRTIRCISPLSASSRPFLLPLSQLRTIDFPHTSFSPAEVVQILAQCPSLVECSVSMGGCWNPSTVALPSEIPPLTSLRKLHLGNEWFGDEPLDFAPFGKLLVPGLEQLRLSGKSQPRDFEWLVPFVSSTEGTLGSFMFSGQRIPVGTLERISDAAPSLHALDANVN